MRTLWFGQEAHRPGSADILAALAVTAGRLAEAATDKLGAIILDEDAQAVVGPTIEELRRAVAALTQVERPFRVALMGRTMAGKSTLFEALTGGNGSRMGKGAQRTTREACERPVVDMPGVSLVDTPGVGAKDGHEDRLLAFNVALKCDLVLWVAANDSTQQETADALTAIADLGKPLIVVLNCRQGIGSSVMRQRFLRDPGRPFRDKEGHFNRLSRILRPLAVRPSAITSVHAQAAFHGLVMGDQELLPPSRINAVLDAMRAELSLSPQRQALTMLDSLRGPVADGAMELRTASDRFSSECERTSQAADEYNARLARVLHEAHAEGELQLLGLINQHRDWHVRVDLDVDVGRALAQQLLHVSETIEGLLLQIDEQLHDAVVDEHGLFVDDWTLPPLHTSGDAQQFADPTARGNRAAKIIARTALGVMSTVVLVSNPVGWATAGVVVGSFVLDRVLVRPAVRRGGWIDRSLPGRHEKRRQLREQLAAETRDGLAAIHSLAGIALTARREAYEDSVEKNYRAQLARAAASSNSASQCGQAATELLLTAGAFDAEAARALLALAGRMRCAQGVTECARHPGRGMAVGFTAGVAVEEVLFPTTTAELIYPFDADAPRGGPRRVLHVVSAAYPPPYRATLTGTKLSVSVGANGESTRGVTVADLASRVSDLNVSVTFPTTSRH